MAKSKKPTPKATPKRSITKSSSTKKLSLVKKRTPTASKPRPTRKSVAPKKLSAAASSKFDFEDILSTYEDMKADIVEDIGDIVENSLASRRSSSAKGKATAAQTKALTGIDDKLYEIDVNTSYIKDTLDNFIKKSVPKKNTKADRDNQINMADTIALALAKLSKKKVVRNRVADAVNNSLGVGGTARPVKKKTRIKSRVALSRTLDPNDDYEGIYGYGASGDPFELLADSIRRMTAVRARYTEADRDQVTATSAKDINNRQNRSLPTLWKKAKSNSVGGGTVPGPSYGGAAAALAAFLKKSASLMSSAGGLGLAALTGSHLFKKEIMSYLYDGTPEGDRLKQKYGSSTLAAAWDQSLSHTDYNRIKKANPKASPAEISVLAYLEKQTRNRRGEEETKTYANMGNAGRLKVGSNAGNLEWTDAGRLSNLGVGPLMQWVLTSKPKPPLTASDKKNEIIRLKDELKTVQSQISQQIKRSKSPDMLGIILAPLRDKEAGIIDEIKKMGGTVTVISSSQISGGKSDKEIRAISNAEILHSIENSPEFKKRTPKEQEVIRKSLSSYNYMSQMVKPQLDTTSSVKSKPIGPISNSAILHSIESSPEFKKRTPKEQEVIRKSLSSYNYMSQMVKPQMVQPKANQKVTKGMTGGLLPIIDAKKDLANIRKVKITIRNRRGIQELIFLLGELSKVQDKIKQTIQNSKIPEMAQTLVAPMKDEEYRLIQEITTLKTKMLSGFGKRAGSDIIGGGGGSTGLVGSAGPDRLTGSMMLPGLTGPRASILPDLSGPRSFSGWVGGSGGGSSRTASLGPSGGYGGDYSGDKGARGVRKEGSRGSGTSVDDYTPDATMTGISGKGGPTGEVISKGEGGYGSYNRGTAGDSRGKIDFSKMTVRELMAKQRKGPGRQIFAFGKYQIIPDTMKEAVRELKIDPNTKVTPELQEKIYREYLIAKKRPQIKDYITGKSDDIDSATIAASKEFASVGVPFAMRDHRGRMVPKGSTYYGGVGGNKASTSPDKFKASLIEERRQYMEKIKAGINPSEAWSTQSGDPIKPKSISAGNQVPTILNSKGNPNPVADTLSPGNRRIHGANNKESELIGTPGQGMSPGNRQIYNADGTASPVFTNKKKEPTVTPTAEKPKPLPYMGSETMSSSYRNAVAKAKNQEKTVTPATNNQGLIAPWFGA